MTQFKNIADWQDQELLQKIIETGIPYAEATTSVVGGVKQAAAVSDAVDVQDIVTQFNALLSSLVAAGIMENNT